MVSELTVFLIDVVITLVSAVLILGTLYQYFFKNKDFIQAITVPFGNRTPEDSADSKSVESVDQVTLTKRKKRWLIAIIVVFNILFFYTVYAYVLQ